MGLLNLHSKHSPTHLFLEFSSFKIFFFFQLTKGCLFYFILFYFIYYGFGSGFTTTMMTKIHRQKKKKRLVWIMHVKLIVLASTHN